MIDAVEVRAMLVSQLFLAEVRAASVLRGVSVDANGAWGLVPQLLNRLWIRDDLS